MASKNAISPVDIFHCLSPADKRKVFAALRKSEPTVCERLGHSLKPATKRVERTGLWSSTTTIVYLCTKCGHQVEVVE